MSKRDSYSRRLGRWLERLGLIDDPFALYEADREGLYLPYFFVDRPYVHDVLGDPDRPQAAFLMAGRGAGKTATREMVAYECAHARLRRRALAVRYLDFSPLLEQTEGDLTQINVRHHVRTIVRCILKTLAEDVPPTYFDLLEGIDRSLLMGYVTRFADPVTRLKLSRIVQEEAVQLSWDDLSPLETLETLTEIATHMGQSSDVRYQALYVLVDRVDETSAGPEAAVPLLRPLVSQGPLLEMAYLAFKFFLPIEVGEQLRQTIVLRPDRLCIRTITWNETALRKMIQQRLSYFSEGRIQRMEELCTPGAKAGLMDRLIRACEGCPRTLLRLCHALIHQHIAHADDTRTLIDRTDLLDTLRDFAHQLRVERAPLSLAAAARTAQAAPGVPPESGLYLDDKGHVWIDGEPVTPTLSELEFRLLEALYRQAPEIVPHAALIEAVWPSSAWSDPDRRVYDKQNLRKLIARLRDRLEPGVQGNDSRFVQNVRGRGYWLKAG